MIIDFHTHLDFYKQNEIQTQLSEFSGILVAASVDEKSFLKNCEIAEWTKINAKTNSKSKSTSKTSSSIPADSLTKCRIIPTFGIHPNYADENAPLLDDPATTKRFEKYLEESPIIGEIGMDFCWSKCSRENQEKVFRWFMEYSNKTGKPCVIHTKDAEQKICDILSDYSNSRPVIHWYDGPERIFREFIRRGYPQTFGVETIRSKNIQKLLSLTPRELLLAETDNPDSEIWLGGTRNDICLIERVYDELAELLKIPRPHLEKIIEENFRRIIPLV